MDNSWHYSLSATEKKLFIEPQRFLKGVNSSTVLGGPTIQRKGRFEIQIVHNQTRWKLEFDSPYFKNESTEHFSSLHTQYGVGLTISKNLHIGNKGIEQFDDHYYPS